MAKQFNEFDPFLNECETYVWEWYIPEQKVRFGIPSLNSLWIDDREKNIQLATMLERVHPDDIQKVLVRHTSPLYKSDKMFEVDIRLNVAAELTPGGKSSGRYEWYGFRGSVVRRDAKGRPTYLRGIAINLDQRYRAQKKLIGQKERQLKQAQQKSDYCISVIQEVGTFIRSLAENTEVLINSDTQLGQESRLMRLTELKEQVGHLLELTDRFKFYMGDGQSTADQELQSVALWEHMAELQQVYSLKAGSMMKFYFSNLYDNQQMHVDVKVFDLLLDNVIVALLRLHNTGCATLSYQADAVRNTLCVTLAYSGSDVQITPMTTYTESGLGLSVCRLMAKRLWGDVRVEQFEAGKLKYIITLPLDSRKAGRNGIGLHQNATADGMDVLDELSQQREAEAEALQNSRSALPQVLIGMSQEDNLYRNQHLFEVNITTSTDALLKALDHHEPDIVFVDTNLKGSLPVMDLIAKLHAERPHLPIIVTDDYALRPLHKQVRQLGAQYMLTNPLSLRKVNMMIKKYFK